jgi:uncharacterized protein (TIGR00251 family)
VKPVRLAVHVTPRAGADTVGGWRGAELAVRVTAPPDEGRANDAVCRLVAKSLGLPKSAVAVERGGASRHKLLAILGVDAATVERAFGSPGDG